MRINPIAWFPEVWKRSALSVVGEYADIALRHQHFLADIALRGHVYTEAPAVRDLFQAGVNEGRRQIALEIINMCNAPHDELRAVIDAAQRGGKP